MDEETARRLVAAARSSEAVARPSVDEGRGRASPPPGLRSPSPAPARDRIGTLETTHNHACFYLPSEVSCCF